MPRPAINDYTFYKIVNINGDVDLCYVGSTGNMKHRRKSHKNNCYNETYREYNSKLYKTIREHGGWNEFKMIEIGTAEQLTHTQALQKEEEYRVELKANMNSNRCFQTEQQLKEYNISYRIDNADKLKQKRIDNADKLKDYRKQYRIDNADKIKEKEKRYHADNADKIKERRGMKETCECGSKYSHCNRSSHLKTKKHLNYVKSLTV